MPTSPAAGPSCVVVTDDSPALASQTAERLSARLWELRRELTASPPGPEEAVGLALAAAETPVVLVDLGDNVGGGSAADSTVLIHELIRQGATGSIVVLYDPEAVRECARAGVGHEVELERRGQGRSPRAAAARDGAGPRPARRPVRRGPAPARRAAGSTTRA